MVASPNDEPAETTAVSHTPGTPQLQSTLSAFANASQAPLDATDGAADSDSLDLSLLKKKKKKVVKIDDDEAAADEATGEEAGLDLVSCFPCLSQVAKNPVRGACRR